MTEQKNRAGSRRLSIGFSVTGALITTAFLAFINFYTSASFPWFIFPAYALLWWPVATVFAGRHRGKILSLFGSVTTIALLVAVNYLTSWSYPWFLFPSFALLFWPVSMFLGKKNKKLFAVVGFLVLSVFFVVTNLVTSPVYLWFYYPIFALVWWPLSVLLAGPRTVKIYSVLGAAILIVFLAFENLAHTPFCPWAALAVYPILMWPAGMLTGRALGRVPFAIIGSVLGILYYMALNVYIFTGFPWSIFVVYALLWWPLSAAFARRKSMMLYAVVGFLISAALMIATNAVTTPDHIWAVYPVFGFAWWPLSVYYFVYRRRNADALPPERR